MLIEISTIRNHSASNLNRDQFGQPKNFVYNGVPRGAISSQCQKKARKDSLIFKEGYFDSMGFVVLITYLEENFGIKTTDADLVEENFESINAITDFIIRKNSN